MNTGLGKSIRSNLPPSLRYICIKEHGDQKWLISPCVSRAHSLSDLPFKKNGLIYHNWSCFPISRNNCPYNNLHKKDIFFIKWERRCLGWNLRKLFLSSLALLIMSQQQWPLAREAFEEVTVTHRLNYTMYCDAIRKKDEMTKQISPWSSAGLPALSHCNALPTTHQLLLLNPHLPPRNLPFQTHEMPLGKFCLLWYYKMIRHLSYMNMRAQITDI